MPISVPRPTKFRLIEFDLKKAMREHAAFMMEWDAADWPTRLERWPMDAAMELLLGAQSIPDPKARKCVEIVALSVVRDHLGLTASDFVEDDPFENDAPPQTPPFGPQSRWGGCA